MCIRDRYRAITKIEIPERVEFEERLLEEVRLTPEKYDILYGEYMRANLVIVDEAQHIPAKTVHTVLMTNPFAFRLAMSATPWRDDESKLEIYGMCGKILEPKVTASYLVKRGWLVPAKIIQYVIGLKGYELTFTLDRFTDVIKLVMLHDERNKIIAEIVKYLVLDKKLYPGLILVRLIDQGFMIKRELDQRGVFASYIYGAVPITIREDAVRLAEQGKIHCIIATQLADEGFDLPPMRWLLIASAGKSTIRAIQRVGRVVRPLPPEKYPELVKLGPKKAGLVIDLVDSARWLWEHGDIRRKTYEREPAWRPVVRVASLRDLKMKIDEFAERYAR